MKFIIMYNCNMYIYIHMLYTHIYTPILDVYIYYDVYYPQIVDLLSHPNEVISAEVLALLAAMLYAGNKNIQV